MKGNERGREKDEAQEEVSADGWELPAKHAKMRERGRCSNVSFVERATEYRDKAHDKARDKETLTGREASSILHLKPP